MKNENDFYVYKWFNVDTGEVFYVGKGRNNRYKDVTQRNKYFKNYYNKYNCDVSIVKNNLKEAEAFELEIELIKEYRTINQCQCNLSDGGEGCTFQLGSWNDLFSKLKTLYYAAEAMNEMSNEEDYDPLNLKTKSLEELKKLYDEYYIHRNIMKEYKQYKNYLLPFNSFTGECELSAFEIETKNKEVKILTNLIKDSIIKNNREFNKLSKCISEIDYLCTNININKFIDLILKDIDYCIILMSVLRSNLWALKRIGNIPNSPLYIRVKSFNTKENFIHIKFNTKEDKKLYRIKIDIYNIVFGILAFKDKTLFEIIYDEIFNAPFNI